MLSRAGGRYRLLGAVGLAIMAAGMALLARMTIETSYAVAVTNLVITGFGLGITMPLYAIIVQNAVPYNFLGAATSSIPFFRSLGGSVGLAIFGSVMNNRFASGFISGLPALAKAAVPPDLVSFLTHDPQALLSTQAQEQLKTLLSNLGAQDPALSGQVLLALRQALDSALSLVFLIGLSTVLIALIVHFFIKEIPLRKQHILDEQPGNPKPINTKTD